MGETFDGGISLGNKNPVEEPAISDIAKDILKRFDIDTFADGSCDPCDRNQECSKCGDYCLEDAEFIQQNIDKAKTKLKAENERLRGLCRECLIDLCDGCAEHPMRSMREALNLVNRWRCVSCRHETDAIVIGKNCACGGEYDVAVTVEAQTGKEG